MLASPRTPMTRIAGMIASARVISRRNQGWIRQCMNPSITTCPASVPVMVLLWPLASNAITNSVLASDVPSKGANVRYAMRIQSLFGENVTNLPPDTSTLVLP